MFKGPIMGKKYPVNGVESIIAFTDNDLFRDKNRYFWKGESQHKRAF